MKGRKNERERVVDKGWEDGWRESRTSGSMNEWMDGWEMGKGKIILKSFKYMYFLLLSNYPK